MENNKNNNNNGQGWGGGRMNGKIQNDVIQFN